MSNRSHNFEKSFIKLVAVSIFLVSLVIILWKLALDVNPHGDISLPVLGKGFILFALVYLVLGILLYFFRLFFTKYLKILTTVFALNILYLITETVLYLLAGFNNINLSAVGDQRQFLFSNPCFNYDIIRGYRWDNSLDCREVLLTSDRTLVWDTKIKANNKGYISSRDYHLKKKDAKVKRYIVLGDSYSAADFNQYPWSDYAQQFIGEEAVEVYSLALSGAGILNWHTIYFKEIKKKYEYDGVIIAFHHSNWPRNFSMFYTNEKQEVFIGSFKNPPQDSADFLNNYVQNMRYASNWKIISDEEISDRINNKYYFEFQRPTLFLLEMISQIIYHKIYYSFIESKKEKRLKNYDMNELVKKYGKVKIELLRSIIEDAKIEKKSVIIASIPYAGEAISYKRGKEVAHHLEMQVLASSLGVVYFNGLEVFSSLSEEEIRNCFYKKDAHWNDKGSKLFAKKIASFLINSTNKK